MTKIYVETYGCWLNKGDSNIMITQLLNHGYEIVSNVNEADIIIVNTCAVREETEIKIFKRLKQLYDKFGDSKKYVIVGCLVKARPSKIREIIPKSILVDTNKIEDITVTYTFEFKTVE